MRKGSRLVLVPVALMVLPVIWSDALAAPSVVRRDASAQEQQAAAAYWTRERIAAARPLPMLIDRGSPQVSLADLAQESLSGPPGSSPAGAPDASADQVAQMAFWRDWAGLGEETLITEDSGAAEGTFGVYTFFDVNKQTPVWKQFPHRTVGKLTFTTPTGTASCSATAVSGNVIVTAAHCLYDTFGYSPGRWYTNWVFTPAYRNGSAPYGTFAWSSCTILTAWINQTPPYSINNHARYDVGVCKVRNNAAGQTLNAAVGFAGRSWNQGYQQLSFNMGYPARYYNNTTITDGPAQYLRTCVAESFQQTTETLGMGCNWGAGISGGPWLRTYKLFVGGANNYVNAVNSGLYVNQQNIYAGRFNSSNIVLLCNTAGC